MLLVVLFLALPASAHTPTELEQWVDDWALRADEGLSTGLMDEYRDMRERHSYYFDPAPASVPSSSPTYNGGVAQWADLVAVYFAPGDVSTALCLIGFESKGDPNAYNPSSGASGLMQVLRSWAPKFGVSSADLFDPATNLRISASLKASGGWRHWSPWNRGLCH